MRKEAPPPEPSAGGPAAWYFAFQGTALLSASRLRDFFGQNWAYHAKPWPLPVLTVAWAVSMLAYPLAWAGMLLALRGTGILPVARVRTSIGRYSDRSSTSASDGGEVAPVRKPGTADPHRSISPRNQLVLLALACILTQAILDIAAGVKPLIHYHHAVAAAWIVLAWTAADWISRCLFGRIIIAAYVISLAAITSATMLSIHRTAGNRLITYGSVLSEQIGAVQTINQYTPAGKSVSTNVDNFTAYPEGLITLSEILPRDRSVPQPPARLAIRYANPGLIDDGHLRVDVQLPTVATSPTSRPGSE
jgi:hypothetical protein